MKPIAEIVETSGRRKPLVQDSPSSRFDPMRIRADFPILSTTAHSKPLVYLDNGATTQKPRQVIDAISRYYETQNANIHRGVYHLSQVATEAYETARRTIAKFVNAAEDPEIIFTRGTTEAINLVAAAWGRTFLRSGDEIIVSAMEHHSNIVPWQIACEIAGAKLRVIPMNDAGELLLDEYGKLLNKRTKLVAVTHLSNSLGTINDVRQMASMAHGVGARILVDGANGLPTTRQTSARSIATSTPSPATSSSAPPASACSTASVPCSKPWARTRAAGT